MTRLERTERCLYRTIGPLPKDLTPTANLVDDLGFDSLDQVELVMELEQEFKVEVSDVEGDRLKTWGDCIKLVNKLLDEQRAQKEKEVADVVSSDERKQHADAAGAV